MDVSQYLEILSMKQKNICKRLATVDDLGDGAG